MQLRPAASEADSRDTVERMADQLQELEDRNQQPDARDLLDLLGRCCR